MIIRYDLGKCRSLSIKGKKQHDIVKEGKKIHSTVFESQRPQVPYLSFIIIIVLYLLFIIIDLSI